MSPRLIPENPVFPQDRGAERAVWEQLSKTLPDEATLMHSVRITHAEADAEGDLIVLWPDVGIAFIEVKGGTIQARPDGKFDQTDSQGVTRVKDPIEQSRKMNYELEAWVRKNTSVSRWFTNAFMAALPFAVLSQNYTNPRASRNQIVDKNDLSNISNQIWEVLLERSTRSTPPSSFDVETIVFTLQAYILDVKNPVDFAEMLDERTQTINRLMRENYKLLNFVSEVKRFEVLGPAGTGKTSLAVELGRRLATQGQDVLYVCYSTALAIVLKHQEESVEKSQRMKAVNSFHALASDWGVRAPDHPDDVFWQQTSARELQRFAEEASHDRKFDSIIVDEDQDFNAYFWAAIEALLKDPTSGGIYAFGDRGQKIFNNEIAHEIDFVPLRLSVNLRNSIPIAQTTNLLTDTPSEVLGFDGPSVYFCETSPEEDLTLAAERTVDFLLDFYKESDIALLMTKHRHGIQEMLEQNGNASYIKTYWDDKSIFYSTVGKFKGLERNCVVLCVDGFHDNQDPRELLYTGMTRATGLLVVVGARELIAPHVSKSVMQTLEANPLLLPEEISQEDSDSEESY